MAYINIPSEEQLPGIRGLMAFSPETAKPLNALAEILLRDTNNSLSQGERELIATYVSYLNNCTFCQMVHGSAAQCYLEDDGTLIEQVKKDMSHAPISEKLKSLLVIAAAVQKGGKFATENHIQSAKEHGVTDKEIHDTVLISAAFCMFNRYVDGLGTWAPQEASSYLDRGPRIRDEGYANFDPIAYIKG
ncbi:MAG: carboxymuconolactone decarboxylase family protein [Flectobacillus sp.]|uniref:carboxymuconolactone decarboxylase family protein n=1 Tax=Flectobacillus sp. TaxID=50419 RepID=UPI003B98F2FD